MERTRKRIILVDDMQANLELGRGILKTFYEVFPAPSAEKLFEILGRVRADLILLDIEMPGMSGMDAIKRLKADPETAGIPVIFLTSVSDSDSEMAGFDLGAADYITKPFSGPLLLKRIENQLLIEGQRKSLEAAHAELQGHAASLEGRVREKTEEVTRLQGAILATVSNLVEFRDRLTGGHIARTQRYMQVIVDGMVEAGVYAAEIRDWDMEYLLPAAQLHDVGKIAIADAVLNKPGRLTPEEFEAMKGHVNAGVDAIEQIMAMTDGSEFLHHALYIAGTHHEMWDGTGYPIGLKGQNIPLEGRIMAIADVFDALISERPYKKALSADEAFEIIRRGAGTHFDPALVEVFLTVRDRIEGIVRE